MEKQIYKSPYFSQGQNTEYGTVIGIRYNKTIQYLFKQPNGESFWRSNSNRSDRTDLKKYKPIGIPLKVEIKTLSLGDRVKDRLGEKGKIVGIDTSKDEDISYLVHFNDGTTRYTNNPIRCWFWE